MRKLLLSMGLALVAALGCAPYESTTLDPVCPDPAEGDEVYEECGVWASTSLGDDANPGTRAKPVASLSHAIELAAVGEGRVYACGEVWTDPVELPGHVSLIGGFDCAHGWKYRGEKARAALATAPDLVPLKIVGFGGESLVSDFFIQSAPAAVPGGSSIAVFVTGGVVTTIRRCEIIAGNGADGLDGEPDGAAATDGAPGYPGMAACGAEVGKGGVSPTNVCPADTASTGGKGGDGELGATSAGAAGLPAPVPKDPGSLLDGDGGSGQMGAVSCAAGEPGAAGAEGDFGLGAVKIGRLTADGYVGIPGEDGKPGAPGQGGGGGGGTLGSALACGGATSGGAGGGAGGAGGCGGKGGKGGQPGGSSFAIASRSTSLMLDTVTVETSFGGRGGNGAPGQTGGQGGVPGQGGTGMDTISTGCPGGSGGKGGNGGAGGGGTGGSSIALVTAPGSSLAPKQVTYKHGGAAQGGEGGDPEHYQGKGHDGSVAFSIDLNP